MMPVRQMNIAVIGDEDLVSGMRLAGVSRYYTIKDQDSAREDVRKALNELISESGIGVIALQEDYASHVADITGKLSEAKGLIPVVIEVPSKFGTRYEDVIAHYKTYIRKFIGFEIQI